MAAQKVCPLACKHVEVRGSIPAESACVPSIIQTIHIQITVVQGTQYSMSACVCIDACMYVFLYIALVYTHYNM